MPNYLSRKILTMGKISYHPIFNVTQILLILKPEISPGIATRSVVERHVTVSLLCVKRIYSYSPSILNVQCTQRLTFEGGGMVKKMDPASTTLGKPSLHWSWLISQVSFFSSSLTSCNT